MYQIINFLKKSIFLLIILASSFIYCQHNKYKQINDLLKKAENSRKKFKNFDQLTYGREAADLAEEIDDSQKKAESYYTIARALSFLELQKQSFTYINKALNEPYTKKSKLLQAQLKEIKAFNYYSLGLTSQFNKELPQIVNLLKNQKDEQSIILLQRTYLNIGSTKPDSAKYYSNLCFKELKKLSEKDTHLELSDFYRYLGTDYIDRKKPDSALYYFNKSIEITEKYNDPILFFNYTSLGDYYSAQNQYIEAINYYEKAIQNIKEESITPYHFVNNDLFRKISELYGKLGDTTKKNKYKMLFDDLQIKMNLEKQKNIDLATKMILEDQENEYKDSLRKKYFWVGAGILYVIIIFFFVYKFLKDRIRHRETLLDEATQNLNKKEELITQKEVETEVLQQKINDTYNEVIALAKKNDPLFYSSFQEVYPNFQKKLLEIIPNLRTSELTLCAYTFLGFNIKEIADYTFKSINTIRNRKQNLRKKFDIPTEQDMGVWLRNLIPPTNPE